MLTTELIPATESASRNLVIMLHGLGDSMEGWRWLDAELNLPWLNCLLVNAPDPYYGGFAWYDLDGDSGSGIRRSRQLLAELLDHLPTRGFPNEQTTVLGFSQGCLMALDVGLRHPRRLAGLVGLSGYVFEPENLLKELSPAARELPVLITHGTRDPLLPIAAVRGQIEQLQAAGLKITWREFDKAHSAGGRDELELIRSFLGRCHGRTGAGAGA